jgi:peroxiredoxin
MKTSLLIFVAFLIFVNSCTSHVDKNPQKFTLQGEITGQDSGIIVLTYFSDPTLIRDTAEIKNGKFFFRGKILETTRATLRDGNGLELAVVYFEPRKMKISIFKDKNTKFKMTGSKTQNESDLLNEMVNPFYEKISVLRDQMNKINDSIRFIKNDSVRLLLEKETKEIDNVWSHTLRKIDSAEIKYVMENPTSFITVVYLSMLNANEVISIDSAKSIFNGLDNSLKKSSYGKRILEDIRKKENIRIGAQAPDFKAIDLNQQTVTLSQFKGKSVVLLDFWASWCVPCRESIPHLKKLYKKYHSKGFELITVSEDENRKAWIDAVNQDSTSMWFHIPIAEQFAKGPDYITNDDIYKNYFVQAIPATMIIDKNGKIIYRHVGYSKESEELLDNLLSQIFDN